MTGGDWVALIGIFIGGGGLGAVIFGLALGLVASKVYDAVASASGKHEAKG